MKKSVRCGNVQIGNAPVSIQSMVSADPKDEEAILKQIYRLEKAGCDIVRMAVPDMGSVEVLRKIKPQIHIPLVADIHFDYRLAIASVEAGADKIRINPGNIGGLDKVKAVVDAAEKRNIPIRVGVNSGSLEKDIIEKYGGVTAEGLAESALRNLKLIEDMGYDCLVVSVKASDVKMNYLANRILSQKTDHPIHIGVTEAGDLKRGKIKSAVGLGALLLEGIGDTMRVSLTGDPVEEVYCARKILEAVGLRKPKYDLISCPTCGRTRVDLPKLVSEVEKKLENENIPEGLKIAVMGCAVNGPGEAREADYGVAGGDGRGVIFAHGKIVKTVGEDEIADELIRVIVGK